MKAPDPVAIDSNGQRALRIAALALQSVVFSLILLQGLIGLIAPLREKLFSLRGYGDLREAAAVLTGICVASVLVTVAVFLAAWRLESRSWWRIALGYAGLATALIYLAHDEPTFRHPVTMEEISPAFAGADASYNVLMQYGRQHPLGRNFKGPIFKDPYPRLDPSQPGPWRDAITMHRAEIEAHWAQFTAERAWWTQLSEFDRIGDLMPARFDGEVLSFQVFRSFSQHGLAMASLEALDGHGDQAIDTLLPILEVGRKIQPYSRTLVRDMIGCVIEHISLTTATFILDTTAVSPGARTRLAHALPGGGFRGGRPPPVLHGICAQLRGDEHQAGGGYSLLNGPPGQSSLAPGGSEWG